MENIQTLNTSAKNPSPSFSKVKSSSRLRAETAHFRALHEGPGTLFREVISSGKSCFNSTVLGSSYGGSGSGNHSGFKVLERFNFTGFEFNIISPFTFILLCECFQMQHNDNSHIKNTIIH